MNRSINSGGRNGVAAVEFAFVAPVFFLLVLGLVEMGRMMMVQLSLTNAAREGCRMAVIGTTISGSDVDSAVRHYLQSVTSKALDPAKLRVTAPTNLGQLSLGDHPKGWRRGQLYGRDMGAVWLFGPESNDTCRTKWVSGVNLTVASQHAGDT